MTLEPLEEGLQVFAVRTPTLPPATHTNTYVIGHTDLTVVDPASPYPEEQQRLHEALRADGRPVSRILLTHHHLDHISGAQALADAFNVPIVGHPANEPWLHGVRLTEHWDGQHARTLGGVPVQAHFTPGHAPGHLALQLPSGNIIAGDLVAGIGTIAINPLDGHLQTYLESLQHLQALDPGVLYPAHGPPLTDAQGILAHYISHRHMRSEQIASALGAHGPIAAHDLVQHIYPELPAMAHPIATVQITSHLLWLSEHHRATDVDGLWSVAVS